MNLKKINAEKCKKEGRYLGIHRHADTGDWSVFYFNGEDWYDTAYPQMPLNARSVNWEVYELPKEFPDGKLSKRKKGILTLLKEYGIEAPNQFKLLVEGATASQASALEKVLDAFYEHGANEEEERMNVLRFNE